MKTSVSAVLPVARRMMSTQAISTLPPLTRATSEVLLPRRTIWRIKPSAATSRSCGLIFPASRFFAGLFLVLLSGCIYGNMAWSPDGKWIAFVTQSGGTEILLPRGWWARGDGAFASESNAHSPVTQVLWLCQVETRKCWRLATSDQGISSPAWSPDSRQIAYVRLQNCSDGKAQSEVLLQRGFEVPKVLITCGVRNKPGEDRGLAEQMMHVCLAVGPTAPAWSPRGSYLAVPWLDPPGTAIIRITDAKLMATYPDAYLPSWSPDERRLALVLPGDTEGYHVTLPDFGRAVPAVATRNAVQPAVWESSGQAFHVLTWREMPMAAGAMPFTADLVRYDLKRQKSEVLRPVLSKRPALGGEPAHVFFAKIPGAKILFTIVSGEGHSTEALDVDLDRQTQPRRYSLLDRELVVGSPSFGESKQTAGVRFGPPETLGVPGFYDLQTGELRTIIPDRATQVLAAETISELVLRVAETTPLPDGTKPPSRFVRLPSPASIHSLARRDRRTAERIERLARYGLEILNTTLDAPRDTNHTRALAEFHMFLAYMAGDYTHALRATESLEPLLNSSHDRLALTVVRAQCYIASQKWADARELLTLLRQKAGKPTTGCPPEALNEQMLLGATIIELLEELTEAEK